MLSGNEQKTSSDDKEQKIVELLNTLCVLTDIDEFLVTGISYFDEPLNEKEKADKLDAIDKIKNIFGSELAKRGHLECIIQTLECNGRKQKTHYIIHPGAIESLKWLDQFMKDTGYFSSGMQERNIDLVKQLYIKIQPKRLLNIVLLSRRHCSPCSFQDMFKQCEMFGIPVSYLPFNSQFPAMGSLKKSLKIALNYPEVKPKFENTILFENDPCNSFPGEESHLLCTSSHTQFDEFGLEFANNIVSFANILKLNNIFGVIGTMRKAAEMTVENGKDFFENLFSLQFVKVKAKAKQPPLQLFQMTDAYEPVNFASVERFEYYEMGLKELQKINPNLKFYCHDLLYQLLAELKLKQVQPETPVLPPEELEVPGMFKLLAFT